MNFGVAVKTFQPTAGLRWGLLERTMDSVRENFASAKCLLYDNSPTDDDAEQLMSLLGEWRFGMTKDGTTHTPGDGANRLVKIAGDLWSVDVLVTSDDDMAWKPGAQEKLNAFWSEAPEDVTICCGLLEPVWEHNKPRELVEAGGQKALVRDSVPGAAWSFRMRHVKRIFPVVADFGYDTRACERLLSQGHRVCAMDLCDHAGWGASSHGNEMLRRARPLDREKWGI